MEQREMQPAIDRPLLLALDTSHLGKWCDDWSSQDEQRTRVAREFQERLARTNYAPLITSHHLLELLAIENAEEAQKRISFIKSIPCLTWISRADKCEGIGSIIDLLAFEANAALKFPSFDATKIRDHVSGVLIQAGTGRDAIAPYDPFWPEFLSFARQHSRRAREVASISHVEFGNVSQKKISDILQGRLRSREEIARKITAMEQELTKEITEKGDRRVDRPFITSKNFFDAIADSVSQLPRTTIAFIERNLELAGITVSELHPDATVADIADLGEFRRKLMVAAEHSKLFNLSQLRDVLPDKIPSWLIQRGLRVHSQKLSRSSGSDITDKHLACLTPYADVTTLDKRPKENLRRAKRKSSALSALIKRHDSRSILGTRP